MPNTFLVPCAPLCPGPPCPAAPQCPVLPVSSPHLARQLLVPSGVAPSVLFDLLLAEWHLPAPNLVVSLVGEEQSFAMKSWLRDVLRKGLVKAAQSTGAWILTSALRVGLARHIGQAVRDHSLASTSTKVRVVAIGMASLGRVLHRRILEEAQGVGRVCAAVRALGGQDSQEPGAGRASMRPAGGSTTQGPASVDHGAPGLLLQHTGPGPLPCPSLGKQRRPPRWGLSEAGLREAHAAPGGCLDTNPRVDKEEPPAARLSPGFCLNEPAPRRPCPSVQGGATEFSLIECGGNPAGKTLRDFSRQTLGHRQRIWLLCRRPTGPGAEDIPVHYPEDDGIQGPLCSLDSNLSHFILVEPAPPGKGDGLTELRLRLEKHISEQRTGYGGEARPATQGSCQWPTALGPSGDPEISLWAAGVTDRESGGGRFLGGTHPACLITETWAIGAWEKMQSGQCGGGAQLDREARVGQ
ncbi:hypothetical protein P7K49_021228 [Saguinus oedipus]|uniref:TRPM SLOG domain-containing protein n=1 Tax=Saguinus oedipus TaxID=9490 RepID=A0ABQ9USW3_SAGOE|nr:hypothetical protein P7K49_021228 [Saguinus oedipus]